MSAPPNESAIAGSRQQITAAVLELGEALFDAAVRPALCLGFRR